VSPWVFQPKPKSSGTFSLLQCSHAYDSSESVEKTICYRASKIYYCKLAKKYHKHANFSKENLFFEDYCFEGPMTDGFFN